MWKQNSSVFSQPMWYQTLCPVHNKCGHIDRISILMKKLPVGCLWLSYLYAPAPTCPVVGHASFSDVWCYLPAHWFSSVLFVVLIYFFLNLVQHFKYCDFNTMIIIVNSKSRFKTKNCLLLYFVLCKYWCKWKVTLLIDCLLGKVFCEACVEK